MSVFKMVTGENTEIEEEKYDRKRISSSISLMNGELHVDRWCFKIQFRWHTVKLSYMEYRHAQTHFISTPFLFIIDLH